MNPLEFPKLEKYVNDYSGILTESQISELDSISAEHMSNTSEQVVTILFPHRKGFELIDIGLKVFNENGIGQKDLNNGLLLIIATEEKKIRIITGKGMELKYTEMRCRDIIENHLRPLLEENRYEELVQVWLSITNNINTNALTQSSGVLGNNPRNKMFESLFIDLSFSSEAKKKLTRYTLVFGVLLCTVILIDQSASILLLFGIAFIVIAILLIRGKIGVDSSQGSRYTLGLILAGCACFMICWGIAGIYCHFSNTPTCIQIINDLKLQQPHLSNSSSSDYSSSDSSYSSSDSSYGGGGGSSNGGGYGD